MRDIAVCFLFSYVNPEHELRMREIIAEEHPEANVSLSHEVYPRWREYDRTSHDARRRVSEDARSTTTSKTSPTDCSGKA